MRISISPGVVISRALVVSAAVLLLLAIAFVLTAAPAVGASCAGTSEKQLERSAEVIFKGRALKGPVTDDGELLSPARFRILRYIKGSGRKVVKVSTATTRQGRFYATNSAGIQPRAGERWKILGRRLKNGRISTGVCNGSHRTKRAPRPQ